MYTITLKYNELTLKTKKQNKKELNRGAIDFFSMVFHSSICYIVRLSLQIHNLDRMGLSAAGNKGSKSSVFKLQAMYR